MPTFDPQHNVPNRTPPFLPPPLPKKKPTLIRRFMKCFVPLYHGEVTETVRSGRQYMKYGMVLIEYYGDKMASGDVLLFMKEHEG